MNVWAVSVVLDEADVLGTTLRHLLDQGVDGIVVVDNGSTDGTRELVAEFERTLLVTGPGAFNQGERLTILAAYVGEEHHADWVIPFDADEIWCARKGLLRDALTGPATVAPFFNHYLTGADPTVGEPFDRMPWRWSEPHGVKMAARYHRGLRIGLGAHEVSHEGRASTERVFIHHFPWRSLEHYRRKVARADRMSNSMLRGLREHGDAGFADFYFEDPAKCSRQGWFGGSLVFDPWREL